MANNILTVVIPCAEVKDFKIKETISAICALLNSRNGGEFHICFEASLKNVVLAIIRTIEQRFADIIGCLAMSKKVLLKSFKQRKAKFWIENLSYLCTLNYGIYLPSATQVKCVDSNEPISVIERIVDGKQKVDYRNEITLGSHRREFIKGESCGDDGLDQSSNIQYIAVKPSGSVGDQITNKSSKFRMNISALANAGGGHYYYGISEGKVCGVQVDDQQEVIAKVDKAMRGMIWPYAAPQARRHWDIYFEPVKEAEGINAVPNTFVIVISVVPCPGGVFLTEPESYHVVKGKVKAMSFVEWKGKLLLGLRLKESQNFDECMKSLVFPELEHSLLQIAEPRRTGSWNWVETSDDLQVFEESSKMELLCCKIIEKSMYLKNNGDRAEFERFMKRIEGSPCQTELRLLVLAQKISFACTTGPFQEAEKILEEYQLQLSNSRYPNRFSQLNESYLKSALERSKGDFESSYKFAKPALEETQSATSPGRLLAAWSGAKVAIVLTILVAKEEKVENREKMKEIAQGYHAKAVKALENASIVHDFPTAVSDLQQKVLLNEAFLHLGCSLSGDMVDKESVTVADIEKAKNCLMVVSKCLLDGNSQSRLREVQHNLALCALSLRRSHLNGAGNEQRQEQLMIAISYAEKALELATEKHFEEMCRYSKNFLAVLAENYSQRVDPIAAVANDEIYYNN